MLKGIEHITIRDYSLFEQSNNVKYLLKYRFVPLFLVKKERIESLLIQIFDSLTEKDDAKKGLQREYHRLKSIYRIKLLIALYQATVNLFYKVKVNRWKEEIGKRADDVSNLALYAKKIEEITGIKINDSDDLEKLNKEITRWVDKYKEVFELKKSDDKEKLTFMQVVLGVFAAMNMPINYEMYLSDFFILKREAERIAKIKNDIAKKKNGR